MNSSARVAEKPNVLVIYTDDQGSLDMNIFGASDLYTPNMDGLAKNGVRFTQFYAAAPICSPSRASLFTGQYPQRAGLSTNAPSEEGRPGMSGDQVTMAEMFKAAGYATAHIGKWHLGYTPETMPNQQGFDYSFGHMGGCIDNYSHYYYWGGPNRHDLWRNGEEVWEDGRYFPDMMVEEANAFLKENLAGPFFLYWAINLPHYPLQEDAKWRDYYKDLPEPRNRFAACLSTMDEKIGQLLKKLDELGIRENTIVIFQSDHGHSEEERTFGGGGYAGPYRGAKFSLFEGGTRVPAIISWPGKLPENAVREVFAANVDWYPTLAELCELPIPVHPLDGKSLVPVIQSPGIPSPHDTFFWQYGDYKGGAWAVRQGDWKLLYNPKGVVWPDDAMDKSFLVNLGEDIGEQNNVADKYPDLVKELTCKYWQWIEEIENGK